jgi:TonB family protein
MSLSRRVAVAITLMAIGGAATADARSPMPSSAAGLQVGRIVLHQFEIRLAEPSPGGALVPAVVQGSNSRVYVHANVLATQADVRRAAVVERDGRVAVEVEFTATAAERLFAGTQGHVGKPVAVILDGRVVAAPVLRSAMGASAVITGTYTRAEAEAIAVGMAPPDPGVVRPRATVRPQPVYPVEAQSARVQGIVVMQVVVNVDGTVGDVVVTQSLDTAYGLDQAAVDAVKRWRFTPGTKGGAQVPIEMTITLEFSLS